MAASLLKGTAFITGAASGIGKATAFAFAKHGITRLALTDINRPLLDKTVATLKSQYPSVEVEPFALDVVDGPAVENAVTQTVKKFQRIDVAVNVAGIAGKGKPTHETEFEGDWGRVIDINLHGVWRSQKAELKAMLKQDNLGTRIGRGNIINVASMYGTTAPPAGIPAGAYTAAKHGVVGLTKNDAGTYASQGIRINSICPGYIDTPLIKGQDAQPAMSKEMVSELAKVPMGRLGDIEEIADSIVYMASPMASFMTGSAVVVDGGYTAN